MSNFSVFMNFSTGENVGANKQMEREDINANNHVSDRLQAMIEEYSGLSENELLKEFLSKTIERKMKGDLSNDELEKIKETISPMLNDLQKNKMNELFEMVKKC